MLCRMGSHRNFGGQPREGAEQSRSSRKSWLRPVKQSCTETKFAELCDAGKQRICVSARSSYALDRGGGRESALLVVCFWLGWELKGLPQEGEKMVSTWQL